MRLLIAVLLGIFYAGAASASCPSTPTDCPSPVFKNATVGGTLGVTGASTLTSGTASGAWTFSAAGTALTVTNNASVGGTFNVTSSALNFGSNTAVNPLLVINGAAANTRRIRWQTAGVARWQAGVNSDAESGSNNGSNWTLDAFSDAGAAIGGDLIFASRNLYQVKIGNTSLPLAGASTINPVLKTSINLAGSNTGSVSLVNFVVNSDTLAQSGGALRHFEIDHNFGGTGISGGRIGLLVNMTQAGAFGASATIEGIQGSVAFKNSFGGTNLGSGAAGQGTAFNGYVQFQSGATNMNGGSGGEIDIEAQAGSSLAYMKGWLVAHVGSHAVQATIEDAALGIGPDNIGAARWRSGEIIGGTLGQWPIDTSVGRLHYASFSSDYSTDPSTADIGFDELIPTFTTAAWRSKGVSIVDTSVQIGGTQFTGSSTGVTIDSNGSFGASSGISSAGTTCPALSNWATDIYGGIWKLTVVAGTVTAVTNWRKPRFYGGGAPATLVLTPDRRAAANGCTATTINVTWTTAPALQVQPSGGNFLVGTGSALATTDSSGFLQIATMAGVPTGTVGAAGQAAIVIDTTNKKICYSTGGGTWECSGAFTP